MTKSNRRFSYVKPPTPSEDIGDEAVPSAPVAGEAPGALLSLFPAVTTPVEGLRSVKRREGRTEQKEQLNVRIPRELKRVAQAHAALEGRTIGDLVEELLIRYVETKR